MSLIETIHSPLCRECGLGTDIPKVGDEGRGLLPTLPDCPCVVDFDEACLACKGETISRK